METMTITVKNKKAKRIIEDLAALDVLSINKNGLKKVLENYRRLTQRKQTFHGLTPKKGHRHEKS
jgi:hypothetical protein